MEERWLRPCLTSASSAKQTRPVREKLVMQCGRPSIRDLYRIFPGFRRLPDLAWVRWEAEKRR